MTDNIHYMEIPWSVCCVDEVTPQDEVTSQMMTLSVLIDPSKVSFCAGYTIEFTNTVTGASTIYDLRDDDGNLNPIYEDENEMISFTVNLPVGVYDWQCSVLTE